LLQSRHAAAVPHASALPPPWHWPFAPQQPPLHACVAALQVVVHACRIASQAKPVGQSVCELQPHAPAMHAAPALPPHATHAPPDEPQVALAVPGVHAPAALQQPPLHGCVTEQLVVQT
jgi:hypothetical protein